MFSAMDGLNIAAGRPHPVYTIREEPGPLAVAVVVRQDGAAIAVARFMTRAEAMRWLGKEFPDAVGGTAP